MSQQTQCESFKVKGDEVVELFSDLVHEGNVRRIVISKEGKSIAEFPLTVGIVGAALAPPLAAAGAIAALVSDCTIEVERAKSASDLFVETDFPED